MKIAVASGKGGTGKTFVATNLFRVMPSAALADLDVEAANAHLFVQPAELVSWAATVLVPEIDSEACTGCGACAKACRFNALAAAGKAGVMVFRELCHSCDVCRTVCPAEAVRMVPHEVGTIRTGACGDRPFADGELRVGQVRSTAVIAQVKAEIERWPLQVWDCSPGTSCATRAAVEGASLCVLVTEATPFGLNDLGLAIDLLAAMRIACVVVVNRSGLGTADVDGFCAERGVPVAMHIPFSRSVAEWYSAGRLAVDVSEPHRVMFERLARDILGGKFTVRQSEAGSSGKRYDKQAGAERVTAELAFAGAGGGAADSDLRRLVVVSGKGGTGKTTLVAALAAVGGGFSLADCDVDAANLHLVVGAENQRSEVFQSGFLAEIDPDRCVGCGVCAEQCRFDAIRMTPKAEVDLLTCEGCGLCEIVCPVGRAGDANPVTMWPALSGEVLQADSRCGPLVHGRLWAGGEASGKLVSCVRRQADASAHGGKLGGVLIDGPPGTGCPVNASITGTDFAVVVTEPTQSGLHDMRRILMLLAFFKVPCGVVVNKADLNAEVVAAIEAECARRDVAVLGHVPFDRAVVEAEAAGQIAVGAMGGAAGRVLEEICQRIVGAVRSGEGPAALSAAADDMQ